MVAYEFVVAVVAPSWDYAGAYCVSYYLFLVVLAGSGASVKAAVGWIVLNCAF